MPRSEDREKYQRRTGTFENTSGDGTVAADTDLAVLEVSHVSHVTSITITGANLERYDVVVRDQDGSNETVVRSYATSDLDTGTFENTVYSTVGAQQEIAVINRTQLSDANYAVNVDIHELESETLG